jgi:hypothetical protein
LGGVEDGAIVGHIIGAVGEEEMFASAASLFWFAEIRCIAVGAEDHVVLSIG